MKIRIKKMPLSDPTSLKKEKFDWLMLIPYALVAILIAAGLIVIFYVLK